MEEIISMMVSDDEFEERRISTLVFMDLEATGLPSLIGRKNVHITEISMVAIDRTDFETDSSLRVLNKLSLCVRPRAVISPTAMTITGLYNDVLANQEKFDKSVPKMLEYFFRRLRQPVCLLAHNGRRYDFPLFQAELRNVNYGLDPAILCADTLDAFKFIVAHPTIDNSFLTNQHPGDTNLNGNSEIKPDVKKEVSEKHEHNDTDLDKEIDSLLSEDMGLFQNIEEPIQSKACTHNNKLIESKPSNSKPNPFPDDRTPPKANIQEEIGNPKPMKKLKQDSTPMNKDVLTNLMHNSQAKRQLFTDGDSANKTPNSKVSPPRQFSLEKLYNFYFGEAPPQSHYAEADCIALSKICQKVNKDFLKWVDENSSSFSLTEAMW